MGVACSVPIEQPGDRDGDGMLDPFDNCPDLANADQTDADGNLVGDACQPFFLDGDGDGTADHLDNCKLPNPDQLPDECGVLEAADTDGDTVPDGLDSCRLVRNPEQADDDPCTADIDGDGIPNARDNCPDVPNADQAERAAGLGVACTIVNGAE